MGKPKNMFFKKDEDSIHVALGISEERYEQMTGFLQRELDKMPEYFNMGDYIFSMSSHINTPEEAFYCSLMISYVMDQLKQKGISTNIRRLIEIFS